MNLKELVKINTIVDNLSKKKIKNKIKFICF